MPLSLIDWVSVILFLAAATMLLAMVFRVIAEEAQAGEDRPRAPAKTAAELTTKALPKGPTKKAAGSPPRHRFNAPPPRTFGRHN